MGTGTILPMLPVPYEPADLPANPGLSAEERGWVVATDLAHDIARQKANRKLTSIERTVQIMKMHHRGMDQVDIAAQLDMPVLHVVNAIKGAERKALRRVGAQHEREAQIILTDAILNRLADRMFPEPEKDGWVQPVDIKAVEATMKVLQRRAALTGADMPTKHLIDGEVTVNPGGEMVDKVGEYMNLADALIEMGYGSGRTPERGDDAIDVEVVDARALPPPEPPRSLWENEEAEDPGDLVTQNNPDDAPDKPIMVLDDDPVVRALRLPTSHPRSRAAGLNWGIPADESE